MDAPHPSDGSDPRGLALEITIRIAPDGRVYLHDITEDLLPILLALNPTDESTHLRVQAAASFSEEKRP